MAQSLAIVLILIGAAAQARSDELVQVAALGTPVPEHAGREAAWPGHVDYVRWAGDRIISAGRAGFIRCYQLPAKEPVWSVKVDGTIDGLTLDPSLEQLLVKMTVGGILGDPQTLVLRASDGQRAPTNAKSSQTESGPPTADRVPESAAGDGFVVSVLFPDKIRIWDRRTRRSVFQLDMDGSDSDENKFATDSPFVSNAAFDSNRTLVYTIDNSWATGTVHVRDIVANKELAKFDSRNGHAVMDVDFEHGRIALSGTDRSLTVLDLKGGVIASKDAAAFQRIGSIQLSPDGKRVALGSWDNTVRVFELRSGASK